MKKQATLFVIAFLMSFSAILAQEKNDKKASIYIDNQFVISLTQANETKVKDSYTVDISQLEFKTETELNQFCNQSYSTVFSLKGDFSTKKIVIEINSASVKVRGIDIQNLNKHFLSASTEMQLVFNQIKNQ